MMKTLRRRARDEAGATMVEFALVSIVAFTLMLGLFQFGLVVLGNSAGSNAARDGARVGIIDYIGADNTTSTNYAAILAAVQDNLSGTVRNLSVTARCLNGITLAPVTCNETSVDLSRGDMIEVVATWDHKGFGPFVTTLSRNSTARMVIGGAPDLTVVAAPTPTPAATAPTITSLVLANNAATAGRMEQTDSIAITFSEQVKASTICSPWIDGISTTQSFSGVTVRAVRDGGAVSITVTGATNCPTYHFGTLSPGSNGFVDKNGDVVNFPNSTMSYNGTTNTLTIALGSPTPEPGSALRTQNSNVTASFTPDPAITGLDGTPVSGTGSSSNATQF